MKKVFVIILCLAVLPCLALADDFDLSSVSDEVLEGIIALAEKELQSRALDGRLPLYDWVYKTGVDIAEGEYLITLIDSNTTGSLYFYPSAEEYDNGKYTISRLLYKDESYRLSLRGDSVFNVNGGTWAIQKIESPFAP